MDNADASPENCRTDSYDEFFLNAVLIMICFKTGCLRVVQHLMAIRRPISFITPGEIAKAQAGPNP
jgi:hypothetical protein